MGRTILSVLLLLTLTSCGNIPGGAKNSPDMPIIDDRDKDKHIGTGVGNGGDLTNRVLTVGREAFIESAKRMKQAATDEKFCTCDKMENKNDTNCWLLKKLDAPRREFCDRFIHDTVDQYLKMNTDETTTPLNFSFTPLKVATPDGQIAVSAKTDLGPKGPIWFDYHRIRQPIEVVALLGHEFGHKSEWKGHFVDDESSVGPFFHGRALLDAVGAAYGLYAARHGLVGMYQGMLDEFSCWIKSSANPAPSESVGRSARLHRQYDWRLYDTGVGGLPNFFACHQWEPGEKSRLSFVMSIVEPDACGSKSEGRTTRLEIWRTYPGSTHDSERLAFEERKGQNPICDGANGPAVNFSTNDIEVRIQYRGSYLAASRGTDYL